MAKPDRIGSIEISQDLKFQERTWRVQRIGWYAMLAIVLAALGGLFGRGPLSNAELGTRGAGLHVDYERFARLVSSTELRAEVAGSAVAADSTVQLWIDRRWLEGYELNEITPEPEQSQLQPDRVVYTFRVVPGVGAARVTITLRPRDLRYMKGGIGLAGGPAYSFRQIIYP